MIPIRHPAIGQRHAAAPQWAWVGSPDWVSAGGMFAPLPAAGVRAAKAGLALEFASGDVSTTTGAIVPGISDRLTAVMICESLSSQRSSNFLLGESAASQGPYNYGFYERFGDGGELVFYLHNGTTGVYASSGGASSLWLTTGVPRVWVATYDGATIYLYCDGVAVGSAGQTGSVQRNSTAHLSLGRWSTTSANYRFYAGGVTGRVMGAAEVRSKFGHWRTAYGQLFAPIERRIWVPVSAAGGGSDVSVNLTGASSTLSAGSLSSAVAQSVSGAAITLSTGTLVSAVEQALSGAVGTFSAGTITAAAAYTLAGQDVTAAAGTIIPAVEQPLTGTAITSAQGSISTSAGGDVSVNLSGQALTASHGTLAGTVDYNLSGVAITAAAGTLDVSVAQVLSGLSIASAAGTITHTGGDSTAYSILPPYITVYFWRRTA